MTDPLCLKNDFNGLLRLIFRDIFLKSDIWTKTKQNVTPVLFVFRKSYILQKNNNFTMIQQVIALNPSCVCKIF